MHHAPTYYGDRKFKKLQISKDKKTEEKNRILKEISAIDKDLKKLTDTADKLRKVEEEALLIINGDNDAKSENDKKKNK